MPEPKKKEPEEIKVEAPIQKDKWQKTYLDQFKKNEEYNFYQAISTVPQYNFGTNTVQA